MLAQGIASQVNVRESQENSGVRETQGVSSQVSCSNRDQMWSEQVVQGITQMSLKTSEAGDCTNLLRAACSPAGLSLL